ncbi:MAG: response regulator [Polaromonas sp.]
MPLIVVIDDDAGTRLLVSQVLKKQGCDVLAAEDGVAGLALIRQHRPCLVVSDVQMPLMDGFEVLDQVRRDATLAATPVILLTSLQDRNYMRQGMTTGADDYLTKPFAPKELREAVSAQLNKRERAQAMQTQVVDEAVQLALKEQRHKIAAFYENRMTQALSAQWPDNSGVQGSEKFASATVLYAGICDYGAWAQALGSSELGAIVQQLYSSVGDTVYLFGAHSMQFVGEGLLCVFVDAADTNSVNHGLRAVRAALGLASVSRNLDAYVDKHFGGRGLPRFGLTAALHSGSVAYASLDGLISSTGQATPVGQTVAAALRLFQGEPRLDWAVAASVQTARLVSGAVRMGRRALVELPGGATSVDALEILGLS